MKDYIRDSVMLTILIIAMLAVIIFSFVTTTPKLTQEEKNFNACLSGCGSADGHYIKRHSLTESLFDYCANDCNEKYILGGENHERIN